MGDPTKGSSEKGERIWKVMIENLAGLCSGTAAIEPG